MFRVNATYSHIIPKNCYQRMSADAKLMLIFNKYLKGCV